MKKYQIEKEEKIDRMVKKIVYLFKNYQLKEETKLVAVCENENPDDFEVAEMFNDRKIVTLGASFDELSTYDKLLVAKATIHTYLELTDGKLPIYGRVLHFELQDNSPIYRAFDLNGEYMSIFK